MMNRALLQRQMFANGGAAVPNKFKGFSENLLCTTTFLSVYFLTNFKVSSVQLGTLYNYFIASDGSDSIM